MRQTILNLLEKPVQLMKQQHEQIEGLKEVGRYNQRRLYELEFAAHKMSRACSYMDNFKSATEETEVKIANCVRTCETSIKKLEMKLDNEFPIILLETKEHCESNKKTIRELTEKIEILQKRDE